MKVVYGPLVTDARGRMGGVVASAWRATHTFRRFRAPSNPRTVDQLKVRRIFYNLSRLWTITLTNTRASWTSFASGKNFQPRNSFIGRNVPALNDDVNLADFIGTPGDASTIPPFSMTVTPGVETLVVAITVPVSPTGWTITKCVAMAVADVNYSTANPLIWTTEGEDLTTPYSITLSAWTNQLYQVRGFIVWLAPDGSTRYSASLSGSGTPT